MNEETTVKGRTPYPLVKFGVASDGTPLHVIILTPDNWNGRAVLGVHGGGFKGGLPDSTAGTCSPKFLAAGYRFYSAQYRLAPPGRIDGQVSLGRYPDQTNDVELAINWINTQCPLDGIIGGSAGAYHVCWATANLSVSCGVAFSPATDLEATGSGNFMRDCQNYAPGSLMEASPINHLNAESSPIMLVAFEQDAMPASQYEEYDMSLKNLSVSHQSILLPGKGHSFDAWKATDANGPIADQAVAFIQANT